MEFLTGFFDTEPYPARWHCGVWTTFQGWLHIGSDLAIFLAYTAIPLTIIYYMRQRSDVPYSGLFWLFAAFIFSCGTVHLMEAIIFWHPIYPLSGLTKLLTALVSIATVIALARITPRALELPGLAQVNSHLAAEVDTRRDREAALELTRTALQRDRERLEDAQALGRIGDWHYTIASQAIFWSPQVFELMQRDPALGPPCDFADNLTFYTSRSAADLSEAVERACAGEAVDVDLEVSQQGGRIAWHRSTIRPVQDADGAVIALKGTVQDITDLKTAMLDLEAQRREVERINDQLEHFAAMASHDLIEPVRKARFFTDVLHAELGDHFDQTTSDAHRRLANAHQHMERLTRDLLAFARAGQRLKRREAVPLTEVVAGAREAIHHLWTECGAELITAELPTVIGDPSLLVQVLQNLLTNSCRYRHPDRPLKVRICATPADEGRLCRITISDNGIGLGDVDPTRLFTPYMRGQHDSDGSGIGLALCRRIIEAHGGTIAATDRPEDGCVITLELPIAADAERKDVA